MQPDQINTEPAPAAEQVYRYGQWQDGRVSRWVIDCPLCSRDDEGWMIYFDTESKRMKRVAYRTKKSAEAAINDHFNGDHTVYTVPADPEQEETSDGD